MKKPNGSVSCTKCGRSFKNMAGLSCHARVIHEEHDAASLKSKNLPKNLPTAVKEEIKRLKRKIAYERYQANSRLKAVKTDLGSLADFEKDAKKALGKVPTFAIEPLVDKKPGPELPASTLKMKEVHVRLVIHVEVEP